MQIPKVENDTQFQCRFWTEAETEEFIRLYQSQLNINKVAAKMGRTKASLYYKANELGLSRRQKNTDTDTNHHNNINNNKENEQ